MKQKYLLIGAAIILLILVIISSLFNQLTKKAQKQRSLPQTQSQEGPRQQKYAAPEEFVLENRAKQNKDIAAVKDLFNLFSGPTQPGVLASPTAYIQNQNAFSPSTKDSQSVEPDPRKAFNEFLGIVFGQNIGSLQQSSFYPPDKSGSSNLSSTNANKTSEKPQNLIYYSQCNDNYDNYPLPGGCNICKAGCGPTSVAMILSSYIDKKFTPSVVANLYKQNGLTAGCKGSTVGNAQQILEQNGMKTTDLLYYGETPTEEVVNDLKSYMQYGWTIYMLAKFCPKGCGHFFWIVDVDDNNNVWTYDPGYGNIDGKKIVPLNETSLNPPAKYYVAFGVRKQ